MMRVLYYIILSLYGSINAVIGIQIVAHYLMDPELFANALTDVAVGIAMTLIGVLCLLIFVARGRPSKKLIMLKRRSSYLLAFFAIPVLMAALLVNFFDSDTIRPAYCDVNTDPTINKKYTCDIRALDLDTLNDPNLTYAEDFASGRSARILIANSISFLVAGTIAAMVATYTIRDKRYKMVKP